MSLLLFFAGDGSPPPVSYSNTMSGTISVAGSGTVTKHMNYVPSGTLKLAGTATKSKTMNYVPTAGTIFISASSTVRKTMNYVGSGTITVSGSALDRQTFVYVPSGTIRIAVSAATNKKKAYLPDGQIIRISGIAETDFETTSSIHSYGGNGTIKVAGTSAYSKLMNYPVTSYALKVAASAAVRKTMNYVGSGSISVSGTATVRKTMNYVTSGTIKTSGTTAYSKHMVYVPIISRQKISGTATTSRFSSFRYTPTGVILKTSGSAVIRKKFDYASEDFLMSLSGSGTVAKRMNYVPTGQRINISGIAGSSNTAAVSYSYSGSGKIATAGQASYSRTRAVAPSGTLKIAGASVYSKQKVVSISEARQRLAGTASVTKHMNYVPSGCIVLSLENVHRSFRKNTVIQAGKITLFGTANTRQSIEYSPLYPSPFFPTGILAYSYSRTEVANTEIGLEVAVSGTQSRPVSVSVSAPAQTATHASVRADGVSVAVSVPITIVKVA
jgi:hypothetical protein